MIKLSIVGVGSVGTAIAYACLIRGSARALSLYDTDAKKVRAEVLDLNHGGQFVPPCTVTGSDDVGVTAGSTVVVVTAGAKQHAGQSRLELAGTNVAMAQQLTPQLLEQSPEAVVLFVTNPVDIVTYAAARAVDAPPGRILGSGTVLDSSRFRFVIARRAGIAVGNVHGLIVGEHGDSEISLWSSVSIGGVPAEQFHADGAMVFDEQARAEISAEVVGAAYEIIAGKGATSLAIGLSTARIVEAILGDQHRVPARIDGATRHLRHHRGGIVVADRGRCGGAGPVLPVPLAVSELLGLQASAATLRRAQSGLRL